MIFEFSIARKYLIPRKRQLSMSLIALMSVGVISLVVWLLLVFLSVTDGIEKNWLKKLTSLNAPVRIAPTEEYYRSYYYQVDGISSQSDFRYKSIGEKASALLTDPYLPEEDPSIPLRWPEKVMSRDGSTKDLVKETFDTLKDLQLVAQDYEVSGAILKLRMVRQQGIPFTQSEERGQGSLTQATYLSSFSGKSPELPHLIEPPRSEDLNHLFFLADISSSGVQEDLPGGLERASAKEFQEKIKALLTHLTITEMKTTSHRFQQLGTLLPEGIEFDAYAPAKGETLTQIVFPKDKKESSGKVMKKNGRLHYRSKEGATFLAPLSVPLFVEGQLPMDVSLMQPHFEKIRSLRDLRFAVKTSLQGIPLQGEISWDGIAITNAETSRHFESHPETPPPWPYLVGNEMFLPKLATPAAILPKHFQNSHVQMGDIGYFSYGAASSSSMQEMRLPVTVCGFYDPGVMAIGAKVVLTNHDLPHAINVATEQMVDPNMVNGIQVYLKDLNSAKETKAVIEAALAAKGLSPFWKVTTFHEYDFAKDLLLQFQSDKYLFTLIGIIVLIVACSNIISLLVILVNDKKKEIAILSAMGTSKKRIALIFTLCGGIMGIFSTLIGTLAAMLTLANIDLVVSFLSFMQGHDAFNVIFYGKSLPNELSRHALTFILIATPIISLLAGLVPALKATKLSPTQILRSE